MRHILIPTIICIATLLLAACGDADYAPKPSTYLRIDMPEHIYTPCDTAILPFTFERPTHAQICIKKDTPTEKYIDITYPRYANAVIYLTYKHIHGVEALQHQVDTSYRLLSQHFDYSTGVRDQMIDYPTKRVYTTTYQITGQRAASPYQFYATDSLNHFLRGSLFFGVTPNNDSLAPVIDYIEADINHLLESLTWR